MYKQQILNQLNSTQLLDALEFFIFTFAELTLLFIVISFVVSLINQMLPPQKIKAVLTGNRGYGIAIGLGAVTPFCSCSTLPMTIGLIRAKAAFGPVMAFLFTSPLLNPFIVGLFWISFGAKTTSIYVFFVGTLAILSGYLLEKFKFDRFIRQDLLTPDCSAPNSNCDSSAESKSDNQAKRSLAWKLLFKSAVKEFISFAPYMAIGVSIGAFLHGYVPQSAFESLANQAIWWLIPTAAIIGVFLYIRASTMIPIAASLAAKGMSMGAIMSLTIAGAGASLPEMIMMKRMFHWPLIFAFILLVFTTACLTGFAIDLI
ncbi:permease [Aliikangiella coralliicola]|uniref:Permease n=2 Tax=Aliikangiella coralliicola TaxID=2592383 RepID=A0A545UCL3_9GAMM|nr:permease [Aliikangiella coralliicola]